MSPTTMLVELAEKMGLLAAAALVAVLFPPLRKRVLGGGTRVDKLAAAFFGAALSIWGALLGFEIGGEQFNVRAIGVLVAGFLGGWKAGLLAGAMGGLFYASRVDVDTAPWVLVASVLDGVLAGWIGARGAWARGGPRVFAASVGIQTVHIVLVGVALLGLGHASRYVPAWPAHVVKLVVNAAGAALVLSIAQLVISREEQALALERARADADKAQLESLRRRLEPHFLFNALTAVRATIRKDPARARELVTDLAELYRYLLSHPEEASLASEVEHAVHYLEIERVRLGEERLVVEVDIASEAASCRVPALLLQPLVENAVQHGVSRFGRGGLVRIRGACTGEGLRVVVSNEGRGEPLPAPEGARGNGVALAMLRERLQRTYGAAASLELEVEGARADATIVVPLGREGERHDG